jgi:hypothetical protein
MSILEILVKAGAAGGKLVALLESLAAKYPDAAEEVNKILAELATVVAPDNLIALAEALPRELANIAQGQLDPRRHPSDVA